MKLNICLVVIILALGFGSCAKKSKPFEPIATIPGGQLGPGLPPDPEKTYSHITILSTNDIHGGIEPQVSAMGQKYGGMALFGGIVKATREGIANKFGDKGGVVVVDAGDQFQGTLISNYNEGSLLFDTFNAVGYDAIVPGNHDYDFGPKGWLVDKVGPDSEDKNPRSVIEGLSKKAKFPLLSANTFYRDSFQSESGKKIAVKNVACEPIDKSETVDRSKLQRPDFLQPYIIKQTAGIRVALIGIDNPQTPTTTTPENVSDLCFAPDFESYKRVREELEGKADLFILIIHDQATEIKGKDAAAESTNKLVEKLLDWNPNAVHVVIEGHTHRVYEANIRGVRTMQSGSGGRNFGRVDLTWDPAKKEIITPRTTSIPGVMMSESICDKRAEQYSFCKFNENTLSYDGVAVAPNAEVMNLLAAERVRIAPLAGRVLGVSDGVIERDRLYESPLADHLTDAFREATQAEISFVNTGGIRDNLPEGQFTYEDFFRVLPFSNRGLTVGPMSWPQVKSLLERSIRSCGAYGPLMQSGLRVEFVRNCKKGGQEDDNNAYLLRVSTVQGEKILDRVDNVEAPSTRAFTVATLDFLAAGGSGFTGFIGVPVIKDYGIIREVIADQMVQSPVKWEAKTDGRWKAVKP